MPRDCTRGSDEVTGRAAASTRMPPPGKSRIMPGSATYVCAILLVALLAAPFLFAADGARADRVLIEKAARRLTLLSGGKAMKTYKVALGRNPVGPKVMEGDNRTPEGIYTIDRRNMKSHYHVSLHISYPGPADIERARRRGVDPGGNIAIHGIKDGYGWIKDFHRIFDWTNGCIAVTNEEIEEIERLVPDGTPVEIRP